MSEVSSKTTTALVGPKTDRLPTTVTKPIPYTYTLSHLCATDPNPLPPTSTLLSNSSTTQITLQQIARDGAQSLLNTLLITCPITTTRDGPTISLHPNSSTPNQNPLPLPRRLPLPTPKPPTKWESFARKRGIGKFSAAPGYAEKRKNLVFDEEKGEWVKKWGYKGKNMEAESQWLVELDEKKAKKEQGLDGGRTIRGEGKRERMEKMRRQERKERANVKRLGKGGG